MSNPESLEDNEEKSFFVDIHQREEELRNVNDELNLKLLTVENSPQRSRDGAAKYEYTTKSSDGSQDTEDRKKNVAYDGGTTNSIPNPTIGPSDINDHTSGLEQNNGIDSTREKNALPEAGSHTKAPSPMSDSQDDTCKDADIGITNKGYFFFFPSIS